jgi:hypothetical protein
MTKITAKKGFIFKRKHDGFMFGSEVVLGVDYSTGRSRQDKAEYYEEIEELLDEKEILIREKAVIEERIRVIDEDEERVR